MIQNGVHHGENQPCQEGEDGYIFVNYFVGEYDYLANIFYGALLNGRTLAIDLTEKPQFFIQIL